MVAKVFKFLRKLFLWFLLISVGLVLIYRFVPPVITPLMVIRCTEQAFSEDRKIRLQKDWVSLDEVSPKAVLAVIAAEDQKFTEHWGFDFKAINKAIKFNNKTHGKKVRGGSTISQQTAKNVFLWPGRSWVRKALETYFTFLIEMIWSKERIMEVYLNVIELGDGVYGVEAASQLYFNKTCKKLTINQAASLAAVLPNPLKFKVSAPSGYVSKRKNWIARNMRNLGVVDLGD